MEERMSALIKPSAVFFDLDDTLIQRPASVAHWSAHFAQDFAVQLAPLAEEDLLRVVLALDNGGYRPRPAFVQLLRDTLRWRTLPSVETLLAYWETTFPQCCVSTDGALTVLNWLHSRGMLIGLITNGGTAMQEAKINALGLRPYFATLLISEQVQVHKPDPSIFHLALETLHLTPEQAWYVGDHPVNDVEGASRAGLTSIWLRRALPWPKELAPPLHQIVALEELIPLIQRVS
jgi:FMN phosphatase YigB (HAD superfamily)